MTLVPKTEPEKAAAWLRMVHPDDITREHLEQVAALIERMQARIAALEAQLAAQTEDWDWVLEQFQEYGPLRGRELLAHTKIRHGSCCCCTQCGHYHEECVCLHNELLAMIIERRKLAPPTCATPADKEQP